MRAGDVDPYIRGHLRVTVYPTLETLDIVDMDFYYDSPLWFMKHYTSFVQQKQEPGWIAAFENQTSSPEHLDTLAVMRQYFQASFCQIREAVRWMGITSQLALIDWTHAVHPKNVQMSLCFLRSCSGEALPVRTPV